MAITTKNKVLYGLLIITILLSIWLKQNEDTNTQDSIEVINKSSTNNKMSQHRKGSRQAEDESAVLDIKKWREKNAIFNDSKVDLFSKSNWKSEQLEAIKAEQEERLAEAAEAEVIEPPKPPELPYTYFGQIKENEQASYIILMQGTKMVTTRVGEVINQNWRVDAEDERSIKFTYLPMDEVVMLPKN